MDIQNRVVNYYKNNQFIQKYLKGIDQKTNEVVLFYNNENRRVSIDILESITSEENLIMYLEGRQVTQITETPAPVAPLQPKVTQTVETPVAPTINAVPVPEEQVMLTNSNVNNTIESLNDIKLLTELKNKEGLDNLFKKIAINPTTGLIDINGAISKITKSTIEEVKKSINNNYEFNTDLTLYNLEGKFIGKPTTGTSTNDEKIIRGFNNIKVILEASRMYPEQVTYNDEQINYFMKTYVNKVKEELGLNNQEASPMAAVQTPELNQEVVSPNAGFADIFVLTVIVLVYAVIIINLVLKLS